MFPLTIVNGRVCSCDFYFSLFIYFHFGAGIFVDYRFVL